MAVNLGVAALLARLLAPDAMGAYFLIFNIVSVAALIARFGLDKTLIRHISHALGSEQPVVAARELLPAFQVAVASTLLAGTLVGIGVTRVLADHVFHSRDIRAVAGMPLAIWTIALGFQGVLAETHRGFHDIRDATLHGSLFAAFIALVIFAGMSAAHAHPSLVVAVWVSAAGSIVTVAISARSLARKLEWSTSPPGRTIPTIPEIVRESWPVSVTLVSRFIVSRADLWIVGAFLTKANVALYGAAARLVVLVNVSLLIANDVLPPVIGELNARAERARLERVLRLTAAAAAVPAATVLAILVALSGPVLALIYGGFYRQGSGVLAILCIGQLVNVWVGSCGYALVMMGQQDSVMRLSVIGGAVSVVGSLMVVSRFGMIGVAIATSAGVIVQQVWTLLEARRRCGVWTHASMRLLMRETRNWLRPYRASAKELDASN